MNEHVIIYKPNVAFINGVTASVEVVIDGVTASVEVVIDDVDGVIKGSTFLQVIFISFGDAGNQLSSNKYNHSLLVSVNPEK